MALTFPRRDRPAEFNYITFPISAAPLPDRSDVQASPSAPPSRTANAAGSSCFSFSRLFPEQLQYSHPNCEECKSSVGGNESGESGRHRRSFKPTTLFPNLTSCSIMRQAVSGGGDAELMTLARVFHLVFFKIEFVGEGPDLPETSLRPVWCC